MGPGMMAAQMPGMGAMGGMKQGGPDEGGSSRVEKGCLGGSEPKDFNIDFLFFMGIQYGFEWVFNGFEWF